MEYLQYTFVFAGNASYRNRGCEAIVRGTTKLLREQVGESHFISSYFAPKGCEDAQKEIDSAIVHRPFIPIEKASIAWYENWVSRRFLKREGRLSIAGIGHTFRNILAENSVSAVLMLGGDNYSLDYGPPDRFFKLNELTLEHNIPFAIWGASIGPFSRSYRYERWAANALKKVDLICARETETQAYLASIGVTDNVVLVADPAFFMDPAMCTLPDQLEKIVSQGAIGVNLAPLMCRFIETDKYIHRQREALRIWLSLAADVVRALIKQLELPIILIPHVVYSADMSNNDYLFLKRVAELVNEPERVIVSPPDLNAAQSKWLIGRMKIFAGARTHSTIAAISSGVPTICISYSMKARGIAKDIYGGLEWLIDGRDLVKTPELLAERLGNLLGQEVKLRAHLDTVNPLFRERAREATRKLIELVGNRG
ncbi:MAG: polysaccharide pyruvyl transferase family protein [Anaerolineae bacterium]|nr:polysaccharide pyruvyl transferase family protein [Anaerolineae bacterium]